MFEQTVYTFEGWVCSKLPLKSSLVAYDIFLTNFLAVHKLLYHKNSTYEEPEIQSHS